MKVRTFGVWVVGHGFTFRRIIERLPWGELVGATTQGWRELPGYPKVSDAAQRVLSAAPAPRWAPNGRRNG